MMMRTIEKAGYAMLLLWPIPMIIVLFFLSTSGCGKGHKSVLATPDQNAVEKYQETAERLNGFLSKGFVVSKVSGRDEGQGDSLLFSGLALYALDCKAGQPIADAFAKMLKDLDGGVYRHPDFPTTEVSLDGLLGMYRGIIKRVKICGEAELWKPLLKNHRARMAYALPAEFNLVAAVLTHQLGLNDEPDPKRKAMLANEVASWASITKASKSACYRVHLGLLALQEMDELGWTISDTDRGAFAEATKGLNMPTVDHYSGRDGVAAFLSDFKYNEWQYRHQRCGAWETPDGRGMEHPAVDYLVAWADHYGSPK